MSADRRRLVLFALALAGLAIAIAWWRNDGPEANARPTPLQVPVPAPTPAHAEAPAERTPAPAANAAPAPDAADVRDLAHMRGRCVDERATPLAGCSVRLHGWETAGGPIPAPNRVEWRDPAPVTTRDDGRFEFAFARQPTTGFEVEVQAAGRAPRSGMWFPTVRQNRDIDLGDIALAPGFEVRGRVVDELGAPVARLQVRLQNLPLQITANMGEENRYGESGDDGSFCVKGLIPVGTWPVSCSELGLQLVSPDHVTVGPHGADPVLVTVRRLRTASIEGIVVDERGAPAPGVCIVAWLSNKGGRNATTQVDGTFTLSTDDADPPPSRLEIDDPGKYEPDWHDDRLWAWGSKNVRITVRHALSFELTVVEHGSGAPVTRYAVECGPDHERARLFPGLSGEHAQGRVVVDHVWHGRMCLRVVPFDPALAPSAVLAFAADDPGPPPIRVEVDRLPPRAVRVVTNDGQPVANAKVELVRKGTQPFGPDAVTRDWRVWMPEPDAPTRSHELLAAATTAADGRATLFAPPAGEGLAVRVRSGLPTVVVDPAVFVADQELVVRLTPVGGIVGTLDLPGYEVGTIRIGLVQSDDRPVGLHVEQEGVLADGTFAIHGLAPGTYRPRVQIMNSFQTDRGGRFDIVPVEVQVPEVTVVAGEDTRVAIDARAQAAATVHGRLLFDGAVPAAARAFVRREDGAMFGQYTPDADGAFTAASLPPGSYRCGLVVGDFRAGDGERTLTDDRFALAAGQQLARDFAFVRRRLVITVLQADGMTPAARALVHVDSETGASTRTTDANGELRLDPAPTGAIRLTSDDGALQQTVQLPAGATEHSARVTFGRPPAK